MSMIDITGMEFNMLTVVKLHHKNKRRELFWECKCECGGITIVRANSIKSGHTISCGCHRRSQQLKAVKKHGETANGVRSPEYNTWLSMKDRCNNQSNPSYHNYGGRGIKVCDRWNNSFDYFLKDMGRRESLKYSIDRFPNNNGDYEPGNCRWATRHEQMANVKYNTWLEYRGVKKILTEWSRVLKTTNAGILWHLEHGKSFSYIANHFITKNKIVWNGEM